MKESRDHNNTNTTWKDMGKEGTWPKDNSRRKSRFHNATTNTSWQQEETVAVTPATCI